MPLSKMIYEIYIKSHTEAPDYDGQVEASSYPEALKMFANRLKGEYSTEDLKNYVFPSGRDDMEMARDTSETLYREEGII